MKRKIFYISLVNPFKTYNKIKKVFIPLKIKFRCSVKSWYPVLWCSKPAYIHILSSDVMWKDKWDTPRFEVVPYFWIHLFGLNFIWYLNSSDSNYRYWEQALWYLYYSSYNKEKKGYDPLDINRAKESWPWRNEADESTWNDNFLKK